MMIKNRNKLTRVLSACLVGVMLISSSACTKKEEKKIEPIEMPKQEEKVLYQKEDLEIPDALDAEFSYDGTYTGNDFSGFVADLQGNPAVYSAKVNREGEEYTASISRFTLKENKKSWKSEDLCENALSKFMTNKKEQYPWTKFTISQFRRGDNGTLYCVFTYYMKEDKETKGKKLTEVVPYVSILELGEDSDTVNEILLPGFDTKGDGLVMAGQRRRDELGNQNIISDYHVFEDGNILLIKEESGVFSGTLVDGESGQTIENIGVLVTQRKRVGFLESEYIYLSPETKKFQVASIPDKEVLNEMGDNIDEAVMDADWFYSVNPNTWALYFYSPAGIYRSDSYQTDKDLTLVTEVEEESVGGEVQLLDFFAADDEDFYLCYVETKQEYREITRTYNITRYSKTDSKNKNANNSQKESSAPENGSAMPVNGDENKEKNEADSFE
ncbi:MAG: hypothetical protein K6G63_10305 [Eubacterium sp.]|nr:hypothetical protein [Eubacterium sp.]